jgi:hypothetical protein
MTTGSEARYRLSEIVTDSAFKQRVFAKSEIVTLSKARKLE